MGGNIWDYDSLLTLKGNSNISRREKIEKWQRFGAINIRNWMDSYQEVTEQIDNMEEVLRTPG